MRKTRALTKFVVAIALLSAFGSMYVVNSEEFGPAKQYYDEFIKRPSLQMRTRGRVKLASSSHPGAFKILSDSYAKPEDPKPQVKYLLTSICADYFQDEEFDAGWTEWREKYPKAEDAWLWYRSLILHQENGHEPDLYAVANDNKDLFLRVAALEALCENGSDSLLTWWDKKLEEDADKWKDPERALMLETASKTLLKEAYNLTTAEFRNMALKLIPQIENKKTSDKTKVVMARYFREIFGGDKLFINAAPWLDRLLNPEKTDRGDDKYAPVTPPTKFVGVEAAGKRIVYVIDMSDSMLKPLSKQAKEDIKKPVKKPTGPITGSGKEDGEEQPAEEEKEDEDPLPWDKIKTRFDAAREYLKLSLRSLQKDQFYCVIWFGDDHDTLKSTKGLTPATPQNIEKTCKELDRYKGGAATPMRPDGTLMGKTNLHGGLRQAFKLTGKAPVKDYAYIEPETFFSGADTIFLLSDGDPTWDDWDCNDQREEWDQTGDPESNIKQPDQEILDFPGPYGYWQNKGSAKFIIDDVWRMNLFHKSEIHCIGIGEASGQLLWGIAKQGMGQVKMVGG